MAMARSILLQRITADYSSNTASIALGNSTTTGSAGTSSTGLANVSIATQSSAEDMLDVFDEALNYINAARSRIGGIQSRLDFTESVNLNTIENISSAKSQMMDTDFASEMAELTRLQVLQQAGVSVLSQANLNMKLVLKLLQ